MIGFQQTNLMPECYRIFSRLRVTVGESLSWVGINKLTCRSTSQAGISKGQCWHKPSQFT